MAFVVDKENGRFVPEEELGDKREQKEEAAASPGKQVDIMSKNQPNIVPAMGDNEPIETFRRMTDLSVFPIVDKSTGKIMGIISGYGLQIKFNLEAITETADVEQCAEGLKKLFYGIIMDQILSEKR